MSAAIDAGGSREVDPENSILRARLAGRPLLLMLDVDGTLAAIAPRPSLARVPDETRRAIAALAKSEGVTVVLVSGRAAHDAQGLVGVDGVWTIGNHGAEVMTPSGDVTVDPLIARYEQSMREVARALEPLLAPFDGTPLEDKQWTLSVHYRAAPDAMVPQLHAAVADVAARHGLLVKHGKKVLEIRPPVDVTKGTAIRRLAGILGGTSTDSSLLFAGDDATDEEAFRVLRAELPRAVTIHIGDGTATAAEFTFPTPEALRALLERLVHETSFNR